MPKRLKRFKKMNTDLDTAKFLVSVFGYKILDDLNLQITIKEEKDEQK